MHVRVSAVLLHPQDQSVDHLGKPGEVIEVNDQLADNLSVLSDDPYGDGWMIKLRITDPTTLESLLDRPSYDAYCAAD